MEMAMLDYEETLLFAKFLLGLKIRKKEEKKTNRPDDIRSVSFSFSLSVSLSEDEERFGRRMRSMRPDLHRGGRAEDGDPIEDVSYYFARLFRDGNDRRTKFTYSAELAELLSTDPNFAPCALSIYHDLSSIESMIQMMIRSQMHDQLLMVSTQLVAWDPQMTLLTVLDCFRNECFFDGESQRSHWENSRLKYKAGEKSYCARLDAIYYVKSSHKLGRLLEYTKRDVVSAVLIDTDPLRIQESYSARTFEGTDEEVNTIYDKLLGL